MKSVKEMGFFDHLEEMRWRLMKAIGSVVVIAIAVFFVSDQILEFLIAPLDKLPFKVTLQFLKVQGMFTVKLELAFVMGIFIGIPIIIYQIYKFISPGLTKKERGYSPLVIISFILCFGLGATFSYFIVFPYALEFLLGMGTEGIKPNIDISAYIGFFLRLIVAFGIVFEMPVLTFILTKMGMLTPWFMRKYRSYAIIIIFTLAAVLTPPDAMTQVMLGVPLWILYELSIGISSFFLDPEKKLDHKKEMEEKKMEEKKGKA